MPDLQPKAALRPYWGTSLELETLIPLIRSKLSNTAGGGEGGGLGPMQAHITEECEGKEKTGKTYDVVMERYRND